MTNFSKAVWSKYLTLICALICSVLFFLIMLLTLKDYGTSWDETLHFSRGQVYLNYFLTGKRDYVYMPNEKRSFYQLDYQAGDFWFSNTPGHPPINGILAASFNKIFYQQLGWLSDIHAYHLFNILISSLLVFVVVYFASETFGLVAAIVAYLTLLTYPLFFAEAHFNVKDPAETAFFAAAIWSFYKSLTRGSWRWLLTSVVFFSFGLGTKFNILFLPIMVLPYLLYRYKDEIKRVRSGGFNLIVSVVKKAPNKYVVMLLLAPVIVLAIFIGSWPLLWQNLPGSFLSVLGFYKDIGTATRYQPDSFYFLNFNTFPIQWILFTTPPVVLGLFLLGLIGCWRNRKLYGGVAVLWLLWFLVPILRVSLPGTSIYGGDRQIMEFLPAMALISGLGASQLFEWYSLMNPRQNRLNKALIVVVVAVVFSWPVMVLIKLHPNQNVYFNSLIGGLRGAQQTNFPSWGNSYGNVYLQGIDWLNKNAPLNSRVALIQGTETNAPKILFRPDIKLQNSYWSGLDREGEYLMELTYNDSTRAFNYTWEYVDIFLNPVFEYQVDGVSILKIWKNDLEHTRAEYRINERQVAESHKIDRLDNKLTLEFQNDVILSKIALQFEPSENCIPVKDGVVEYSLNGKNWDREKDSIPFPQLRNKINLEENIIDQYFAAKRVRFVRFSFNDVNSCVFDNPRVKIYTFVFEEPSKK